MVADVPVGRAALGRPGLEPDRRAARRGGPARAATFCVGFPPRAGARATSSRTPTWSRERFGTEHHQIRVDDRPAAAGACTSAVRAMSEPMVSPRLRRLLPAVAGGLRARARSCSPGRAPTRSSAATTGIRRCRGRRATASRPTPHEFFDRDHAALGALLGAGGWLDEDDQPAVRRRALRRARRRRARRPGAAPGHRGDAGRRPGQARRQHDDGLRPGGADAVPRPRSGRAGRRVPPALKLAHGGKGVLKDAARRVLPAEVIDRPKGYFPVPALSHLEGPYVELVREALTRRRRATAALFDPACGRPPARRAQRAPHEAAGQQPVAARPARAVAAAAGRVTKRGTAPSPRREARPS